ncbi:MAG: TAXI family TRAP transporter solute-binding subunit [Deltaproteobacteria bacterium]|nr:TAXI family TRAP transporter solute-binding subunit [Deltaproteobacteria bacterium]
MGKKFLLFFMIFSFVFASSLFAGPKKVTLTWTAGGVGGGWYTMAGGFAEIINNAYPEITVKVVPGGGTVNPKLVEKGDCELGWGLPFILNAAINGEDPYEKKLTKLRAIAGGMSMNYFHFYVGADLPYKNMDEIFRQKKAIRIAVSPSGTSDEWVFRKVLAYYKTSYKALKKKGFKFFRANYAGQASNFKDKNVDAVFTFLAIPASAVTEASTGRALRLLNFPKGLLEYLSKYGIGTGKIPPGTYPKMANANEVVTTAIAGSVITTSIDVPEDIVYKITKAIHENLDKVHRIHASLKPYKVSDGVTGTGVPLHPGAVRYYKEKGVLK